MYNIELYSNAEQNKIRKKFKKIRFKLNELSDEFMDEV